jgi:hypothetical protein
VVEMLDWILNAQRLTARVIERVPHDVKPIRVAELGGLVPLVGGQANRLAARAALDLDAPQPRDRVAVAGLRIGWAEAVIPSAKNRAAGRGPRGPPPADRTPAVASGGRDGSRYPPAGTAPAVPPMIFRAGTRAAGRRLTWAPARPPRQGSPGPPAWPGN